MDGCSFSHRIGPFLSGRKTCSFFFVGGARGSRGNGFVPEARCEMAAPVEWKHTHMNTQPFVARAARWQSYEIAATNRESECHRCAVLFADLWRSFFDGGRWLRPFDCGCKY